MDLAAGLGEARETHETGALDLGTLEARRPLLTGWSKDEISDEGVSFVWGMGAGSTLSFQVLVPRPLVLWLRGWPFAPYETPPQQVGVSVNGHAVGELRLSAEPAAYRLAIPAESLRAGTTRLELAYAWARRPADVWPGSRDERELAVAWDALELIGAMPPQAPRSAGEALFVPAGSGVEYVFASVPGARVTLDGVEGPAGLSLAVRAWGEGGVAAAEAPAGGGRLELALPLARPGWVAVRLEAEWQGATPAPGEELRVAVPAVRDGAPRAPETPARPAAPAARPPNVLLYVADTLRADHLGCYGDGGGLTPRIDALARESVLFENATAASGWTRTSMATVLTGLPPRAHGANRRDQAVGADLVTLAERLRDAGWETAGFVTNPNLAPEFGFDQGFDRYAFLEQPDPRLAYVDSGGLNRAAFEWLATRDASRPFFMYLHSMDPHDPYFAHTGGRAGNGDVSEPGSILYMRAIEYGRIPATPAARRRLLELYAGEIRHNDARFGELLDGLAARGLDANTVVVFLSDHGEEFGDHGWWRHGKTLFQEMLHVPLVIRWPGRDHAGRRVAARARHLDLVPTFLDILGRPGDPALPGRSLVPDVEGRAAPEAAPAESWLDLDGRVVDSVILGDWKLVRSLARARNQPPAAVYDLASDPGETRDRSGDAGIPLELLEALMRSPRLAGRPAAGTAVVIDQELQDRLRAVGYLH